MSSQIFVTFEPVTLKPQLQVDNCFTILLQIWCNNLLCGDSIGKSANLEKQNWVKVWVNQFLLFQAFDIMDTDKDGKISVKNMSQISSGFGEEQISEQELETMIKAVDREGTGLVTFEQFSSIINPPNEMSDGSK